MNGLTNFSRLVGSLQIVVDKFRVDGSRVRVAEVEVGDETGTVSLRARDDQIDMLEEISDRRGAVVLRNATLELYQGRHIRLAVTKWGKLTPYPDRVASTPAPPSRMNDDRYFSFIDLSAVASETAVFAQSDYHASRSTEVENTSAASNQRNRSGQGTRRSGSARSKAPLSTSIKQQPYQDNSRMLRYPGTLHNYAYAPEVDVQPQAFYSYHQARERQPDVMMVPQRYQMQQQQHLQRLHHQMHYQPSSLDGSANAQPLHGTTPYILPLSSPSYDGQFVSRAELAHQPQTDFTVGMGSNRSTQLNATQGELPIVDSPRMNPQAPTFDPIRRHGRRK